MKKSYKENYIIDLARFMATSHYGVTIDDIMSKYEISKRTAERWRDRVLEQFNGEEVKSPLDRKKRWKVDSSTLPLLLNFDFNDVVTLELLKRELENNGKTQFCDFIEKLINNVKIVQKKDINNDIEALMEAEGFAVRQHPHFKIDKKILSKIREAILSFKKLKIKYDKKGEIVERVVHPYGILHSSKSYLMGFSESPECKKPEIKGIRLFLLSKIKELKISNEYFEIAEGFNFKKFANKSFGVYLSEPMNVKLRFTGHTVEDAKNYYFHPTQKVTDNGDNVIVEFSASGDDAICWELFKWGEFVEILSPENLKETYKNMLEDVLNSMKQ